jgi:Mg-chelatase subunit ChlD
MNDLEPKEKESKVVVALDASGSMSTKQSIVEEGMKEVDKTIASDAKTSYYQFSGKDSLRKVTRDNEYEPDGMTALYDAILQILKEIKDGDIASTTLVVITDGEDNDSRSSPLEVEKELLGKIHFFQLCCFFVTLYK